MELNLMWNGITISTYHRALGISEIFLQQPARIGRTYGMGKAPLTLKENANS